MQFWENMEVGNKIELLPLAQLQNREKRIYLSKIQDILGIGTMEILMPMEKGKLILLPIDTRYIVTFYTSAGMFQGECIVKKRYHVSNMVLLVIEITSRLSKKQRREYYRLDCSLEVKYRVITGRETVIREKIKNNRFDNTEEKENYINELLNIDSEAEWVLGTMLDISGGGLRIRIPEKKDIERHLMFRLELYMDDEKKTIDVECNVVSISNVLNELKMMELRCKYMNISNQKREMIIKYIFDEQRKQRARK